jgi:hypothetical protein
MAATGTIRTAVFEEREHIVIPVVALVEGVIWPINAETPELVLAEELAKAPAGWDGRPVMLDHPSFGDTRVSANHPDVLESGMMGRLFNTHMEHKKLVTEAWIDPLRSKKVGAEQMVEDIRNSQEMIEVSVGAFIIPEKKSGIHLGQRFDSIWREIVPDHLAFLPKGKIGACSNEMGCGAPRAATVHVFIGGKYLTLSGSEEKMSKDTKRPWREKFAALFSSFRGAEDEGLGDMDLRAKLEESLRATEPGFLGVDMVFPEASNVIYAVAPKDTVQLFQRSFSVNSEGVVSLGEEKVEVKPVTRFEPVTAAEEDPCKCKKEEEEAMATKKEWVQKILARKNPRFAASDASILEQLSDERLKALAEEPEPEEKKEPPTPPPPPEDKVKDPLEGITEEQVLAKFPGLKKVVEDEQKRAAERRKTLVAAMAKQKVYTEDELKAMPLEQLEKVVQFASASGAAESVDESGRGLPRSAAAKEGEVPEPPNMHKVIRDSRLGAGKTA